MLLVYSKQITSRLEYILQFIGDQLFDEPVKTTTSVADYLAFSGPKINYSPVDLIEDEFLIQPVALLFEQGIHPHRVDCFELNYHKAFFQTSGDLHFDLFAASFYLLSRYEEYLPHDKDLFGRYAHNNSLAFRESFLHQPLVNIWLHEFRTALEAKFPGIAFRMEQFANLVTYDIDNAYAYLHKGLKRSVGGMVKALFKGQFSQALERWRVLTGKIKDPFDCYEWLDALHLYCRLKPYYFFLVAKTPGRYDKNVSTASRHFRELVEYYCSTYTVGIHPSWQSGDDTALLKEEKEWLEVVGDKEVTTSRQHYLRLSIPGTFRNLEEIGIQKEFSMGYGTINGFRASVSSPFRWYDLEKETSTSLTVYPFCFMDATSFYRNNNSPEQAYHELMRMYDIVKKVNGMMITIWHNDFLGTDKSKQGWREMFELYMKETVYWDAYYDGR
ncbi:MAG TPA: polysaccharide deacetylase family protein [Flavitalea sp.]|nr:polysaccharide deacetylase family protein [Flavitalea sp.]